MNLKKSATLLLFGLLPLSLNSCGNLFSAIDKPSGDAQLIAAARACFDKGDITCAIKYYQQASSASADITSSEQVYAILDQAGATMTVFLSAFAGGSTSAAISSIASAVSSGAGSSKRTTLFNAYQTTKSITATDLRNFTQLLVAIVMASEVISEETSAGIGKKLGFITSSPACENEAIAACPLGGSNCRAPSGAVVVNGSLSGTELDLDTAVVGSFNATTPTVDMIYSAISRAVSAINALGATGSFTSGLGGLFGTSTASTAFTAGRNCFRQAMVTQGILL